MSDDAEEFQSGAAIEQLAPDWISIHTDAAPETRRLRVLARDYTLSKFSGAISTVRIPVEATEDKETISKLFTFSGDSDPETVIDNPSKLGFLDSVQYATNDGAPVKTSSREFRTQMVYALCTLTYEHFVRALGRLPEFNASLREDKKTPAKLALQIQTREETKNAYYDPVALRLVFGRYTVDRNVPGRHQSGSVIYTALSHDIVVHEMAHALLDGLRPNAMIPTHVDTLAFHEGFADLVAIFIRFTHRDLLEKAIKDADGKVDAKVLTELANEFAQTTSGMVGALRGAKVVLNEGGEIPKRAMYGVNAEPHALGSILVQAVFDAFEQIYMRKTERLREEENISSGTLLNILVAEAARLANQFLDMIIRAVDYLPPLHITFGDYLRALVTADYDVLRDDPWGYRETLIDSFMRYGIRLEDHDVPDLSEESVRWDPALTRARQGMSARVWKYEADPGSNDSTDVIRRRVTGLDLFGNMRIAVRKLAVRNLISWLKELNDYERRVIGLPRPAEGVRVLTRIESLRQTTRVTPNRTAFYGTVVEIVQQQVGESNLYMGGATLLFSMNGTLRYAISKNLFNETRREEQRKLDRNPAAREYSKALAQLAEAGTDTDPENWYNALGMVKRHIGMKLHET